MLSKWQIWDFHKNVINNLEQGFKVITLFDPWLEFKLAQEIKLKKKYIIMPAFELTVEWLEDRLLGLSLFGESEPLIITQSENLSSNVKDFLKEKQNEIIEKDLILFFNKDDNLVKSLEKNDSINVYKIEAPKFWDSLKLLDFLLDLEQVRLTQEAKSLLLDATDHDCSHFYYYINSLKINYDNQKISKEELAKYIDNARLDQFRLVSLFNNKKKSKFIESFLKTKASPKEAIIFFGFMLSHVIKLMDISYLENKNYKSKYDKEIMAIAGNWNKDDLLRSFNFFEQCQLMAKMDFQNLENFLKYDLEKSFYYTGVKSLDS